jgi:hypothetical protein
MKENTNCKVIIYGEFENERFNRARKAREIADRLLRENKINLEEWEDLYSSAVYAEICAAERE